MKLTDADGRAALASALRASRGKAHDVGIEPGEVL
jgi:hypothetical protein